MWATAAGALGFVASALIDERPDVGSTEAVTPELVDRLSTGPFHLALVCGYLAVAALIVLAGLWRRNVEHRFSGSAGASIVHAGLVASAAGLSLAYGWKGALSRYLEAGPEHATFDERGTFVRTQESAATGPVTGALTVSGAPRIAGTARVGATLTATPGTYAPAATGLSRQWLRDGVPIAGATGTTYRLTAADAGHRVVVRETGARTGWDDVTTASTATAPVVKAVATGRVGATVRKRTVRLRVALTAPGVVPTGVVTVRRGGTTVRGTWTLRNGAAEIVLRKQPHGKQRYALTYAGDHGVAGLRLAVVRVRIP
ncbi:hypothetical protein CCO04_16840 [Pimelobacter sp. 30-1]|nr:hypothetical protein [Pimelobacter sp. 30-1]